MRSFRNYRYTTVRSWISPIQRIAPPWLLLWKASEHDQKRQCSRDQLRQLFHGRSYGRRIDSRQDPLRNRHCPLQRDFARPILGDDSGMFKMLFHREDGRLLGCHCIGSGATELIHVGQAVLGLGGGLDYFLKTVFNYPTLAECYKVAAYNAANKLALIRHAARAPDPSVLAEPPTSVVVPGR